MDPNGPIDLTAPDMYLHRHTCLWRFLSLFTRKMKAMLIPPYLVSEMFPLYMMSVVPRRLTHILFGCHADIVNILDILTHCLTETLLLC